MKHYFIIALITFVVAGSLAYWLGFGRTIVNKKAQLVIRGHSFDIEIAQTMAARSQGLSGRDSLPENTGILFLFRSMGNYGFWMKDMKFPIDILWFRGNELVGIEKNVPPPAAESILLGGLKVYYPPGDVDRVLELNAGMADKYGIVPGDTFELKNFEIDPNRITRKDIHRDPS